MDQAPKFLVKSSGEASYFFLGKKMDLSIKAETY